ncbi:LysR family transcriptional regulator [Archangium lansingense]|uniref:LysR family transcriptional regulator n=1 Tax=Archangium lansingense TaxID=2995310 RepID=UPI003B7CE712
MQKCMDWSHVEFDWNHVRAFLVTADEGSFSAAARALGIAQPTVGRQVAALEAELGVTLFERVGRGLALTPTGLELIEHVRTMCDAAFRVSRVAAGQAVSLDGPVCITASEVVATYLLPPVITTLRARHPGIEVEIVASNAALDLRRREADIAIRSFRPTEPDLIARKIRDNEAYLYATPKYLRTLGTKLTRDDLSRATFIGFDRADTYRKGLGALGLSLTEKNFPLLSQSQHVQWALVREGAGIGIMVSEVGDAEPSVRRVLKDLPPITVPMWLVTHQDVRTSRRVRLVAELLAETLGRSGSTRAKG